MSKAITYALYPKLRKRKVTKTFEQGYGQNGGVSSLGVAYEDTDSDGVLDTVVKNSTRIGAFKRTVGVVSRGYLGSSSGGGGGASPDYYDIPSSHRTSESAIFLLPSPADGEMAYGTDTQNLYVFNGASWLIFKSL